MRESIVYSSDARSSSNQTLGIWCETQMDVLNQKTVVYHGFTGAFSSSDRESTTSLNNLVDIPPENTRHKLSMCMVVEESCDDLWT